MTKLSVILGVVGFCLFIVDILNFIPDVAINNFALVLVGIAAVLYVVDNRSISLEDYLSEQKLSTDFEKDRDASKKKK